jgi:N-acetylmuramoyl-L-alanine amidase
VLVNVGAFASVRMYALWYPSTNFGQDAVVANSGATIGGQFAVHVVVQPNSGSIITASVIHQSITEQTNAHPVSAGQLAGFEVASPNPQYGDPTQNVIVLQSPFVNLAGHNGTYQIQVTVRYVTGPIPFHYGVYWDVGVATVAEWNSLEVALPPTEESPPGSIRYLALIRDWGDANGMDKAHRSRWALPLNSTIPVVGVIIDAGHGQDRQGKGDPGAVHGGVKEADVNWAYAWMLRSKFVQDHPFLTTPAWCNLFPLVAYKTYFLRNGNEHIPVTYPDGSEGPRMRRLRRFIKQYKPRMLVSLHCNAHPNPDVRGVEVLWRHNIDLAWCICVRLFQSLTQQEAPRIELIERNDLRLLSLGDRIASCIVELGYLSNQQDRQQLLSSQYRHKQCGAIHIGCDDYN